MARTTLMLRRDQGSIAYDVDGAGPLVICVPGMGDLRSSYRFLAPALVDAGYRVITTDLRGHGDSDATFGRYGDEESATDVTALIDELGAPAVIIGNSMGAGIGVLVTAARPDLVSGLVLIGPFVRNPSNINPLLAALFRVLTAAPWVASAWNFYLPSLYKGRIPRDFVEYRSRVIASLRKPGYAKAFSLTSRTNHAAAEAALPSVAAPVLVVMGELDPDFPQPETEANWIAGMLHGKVVMVPEAGHYPQSQRPDVVAPAIESFLRAMAQRA